MNRSNLSKIVAGLVLGLALLSSVLAFNIDDWSIVYQTRLIEKEVMKETCFDAYTEGNGTYFPEWCYEEVDYYIYEEQQTGKPIGITDGETIIYNAYKKNGKLHIWKVPVGDRNFEEFGECRQYEIDKGVCHEK